MYLTVNNMLERVTKDESFTARLIDFSNWPALIAILSASVFFLSATYSYIYFSIVGKEFLDLLSTSDYIRQAFNWLPTFIIFNLTLMIAGSYMGDLHWERLLTRNKDIPGGKSVEIGPAFDEIGKLILSRFTLGLKIMVCLTVLLAALSAFTESFFALAVHSSTMIVGVFFVWLVTFRVKRVISGRSTVNIRQIDSIPFIFAILFLTAYVAGRGVTDALADLKSRNFPIELCDAKGACKSVDILKTIEVGIIYLQEQGNAVHFSKWVDIISMSKKINQSIRIPLACRWMPYFCK